MSKVLLLWLVVYVGGILLAVVHPLYPLISYLTCYYAPPEFNWWGRYLPDVRWSLLAALAVLVSVMLRRPASEPVADERNPALVWLGLFGVNAVVVTLWALSQARSLVWTTALLKLVLLYTLIPAAIRTPAQFDMFATAHVAGATYWGYKAWDNPKRSAGRLENVGGPDTQNDNQAAGHLLTVIPFVALFVLTERRKLRRLAYIGSGILIVNVFILCNSRGATLGLVLAALAAIALAGRGKALKLAGIAAVSGLVVLWLADPRFIERQQTTTGALDSSSRGRIASWWAGLEMVADYPLGAGGRAFHILSPTYIPEIVDEHAGSERSAHNTYLQLATEWGIQGVLLWSGFLWSTFAMLHRVRRRAGDNRWFFYRSLATQVALVGTLGAAFFSNRLYGESIYWICALSFALHRIQSTVLAAHAREPVTVVATPVAPRVGGLLPGGAR